MFDFLHPFYWLITLFMLIGIGASLFYMVVSCRQWLIGEKENNSRKRKGGIVAFLLALGALILVMVVGLRLFSAFTIE
jgi:hypothetical protein